MSSRGSDGWLDSAAVGMVTVENKKSLLVVAEWRWSGSLVVGMVTVDFSSSVVVAVMMLVILGDWR